MSLFDGERLLVKATARHARRVAAEGADAIVVAGTTGEPWRLSAEDRRELTKAVRATVSDIPLIVGTGHADRAEAVRLTEMARVEGADAVLAISPPGSEDLIGYYDAVATAAGDLPVLAYHFPQVSPPGIPLDILGDLPVCGIKDSSGDPERLVAELAAGIGMVYVGSPLLLAAARSFGATGAITALANLDVRRCQAAFDGDLGAQADLVGDHVAVQRDFPGALKRLLAERHGIPAGTRTGNSSPAAAAGEHR